jgi:hypothetical protein
MDRDITPTWVSYTLYTKYTKLKDKTNFENIRRLLPKLFTLILIFVIPFLWEQTSKWATGSQNNYRKPTQVKPNPHWVKQNATVLHYSAAFVLFRQFHV